MVKVYFFIFCFLFFSFINSAESQGGPNKDFYSGYSSGSLRQAKGMMAHVVYNDKIYLIGGFNGTHFFSDVEVFYLDTHVFHDFVFLSESKSYSSAFVAHNKMYIAGGFTCTEFNTTRNECTGVRTTSKFEIVTMETGYVNSSLSLSFTTYGAVFGLLNDRFLVMSPGATDSTSYVTIFDLDRDSMFNITEVIRRRGAGFQTYMKNLNYLQGAAYYDNKFFLFGGRCVNEVDPFCENMKTRYVEMISFNNDHYNVERLENLQYLTTLLPVAVFESFTNALYMVGNDYPESGIFHYLARFDNVTGWNNSIIIPSALNYQLGLHELAATINGHVVYHNSVGEEYQTITDIDVLGPQPNACTSTLTTWEGALYLTLASWKCSVIIMGGMISDDVADSHYRHYYFHRYPPPTTPILISRTNDSFQISWTPFQRTDCLERIPEFEIELCPYKYSTCGLYDDYYSADYNIQFENNSSFSTAATISNLASGKFYTLRIRSHSPIDYISPWTTNYIFYNNFKTYPDFSFYSKTQYCGTISTLAIVTGSYGFYPFYVNWEAEMPSIPPSFCSNFRIIGNNSDCWYFTTSIYPTHCNIYYTPITLPNCVGNLDTNFVFDTGDVWQAEAFGTILLYISGASLLPTPTQLDFGYRKPETGASEPRNITFCSNGDAVLSITSPPGPYLESNGDFAIIHSSFNPIQHSSLSPGSCFTLSVAFTPINKGPLEGFLHIINSAEYTPVLSVRLSGNQNEAPFITFNIGSTVEGLATGVLFSGLALIFLVVFVAFVFYGTRNRLSQIVGSSPLFLNVMLLGGFCGLAVNVLAFFPTSSILCLVSPVLLTLAYDFIFGALAVKTYRLYKIFYGRDWDQVISNKELLGMLSILIIIESICVGIELGLYPPSTNYVYMEDGEHFYKVSSCQYLWHFYLLIFGVKTLLMFFTCYLAYKTKNIPSMFNESSFISFSIYNFTLFCIFYGILIWVVEDPTSLYYINQVWIPLVVISTLGWLFMPKIISIIKGEKLRMSMCKDNNPNLITEESNEKYLSSDNIDGSNAIITPSRSTSGDNKPLEDIPMPGKFPSSSPRMKPLTPSQTHISSPIHKPYSASNITPHIPRPPSPKRITKPPPPPRLIKQDPQELEISFLPSYEARSDDNF